MSVRKMYNNCQWTSNKYTILHVCFYGHLEVRTCDIMWSYTMYLYVPHVRGCKSMHPTENTKTTEDHQESVKMFG